MNALESSRFRSGRVCPICTGSDVQDLLIWAKEYHIALCRECKTVYTHPLPSDEQLAEYYQGFMYRKPKPHEIRAKLAKKKRELADLMKRSRPPGRRILDFGGGTGIATLAALELGLDAYLQEIDESAIDFAIGELGISDRRVIRGELPPNERFHLIYCDNVIEHVKDPIGFLRRLRAALCDDGVLLIKTPYARNTEAIFYPQVNLLDYVAKAFHAGNPVRRVARAYCLRWWHCDPPRNLYALSPRSMSLIASRADCNNTELWYYRVPLWEYSLHMHIAKAVRAAGIRGALTQFIRLLRRTRGLRKALLIVGFPLVLVMEWPLKSTQYALRLAGLTSPGGIIMKVRA